MTRSAGPLEGIRILDLTRLLPGPLATQQMADLGAGVIKIEDPRYPDYTRFFPPLKGSQSIHYLAVNRSKKSLAIDLGSEAGIALFLDLVKQADAVIEGYRPGRLDQIGIGYAAAKMVNPGIIYVSITGYGQTGPMRDQAGHDLNYIGYAGILGLTGTDGKTVMPGVQIADILGGSAQAVIGLLSALLARQRTGKGDHVDVSMADGALQVTALPMTAQLNFGTNFGPGEFMLSGGLANYHTYECADGKFVALGALEPKFWTAFCAMIGERSWAARAFSPKERESLGRELEALFKTRSRDQWLELAADHDVCLTPALGIDEVEHLELYRERSMFTRHEHPDYGELKGVNQPLKFAESPLHKGWAPPLLGEHSREVLEESGFSADQIRQWIEAGVVKCTQP